ncbi:MAG: hypothetical protein QXS41_02065 [Candidatus Woesearchaeota archaeon]
MKEKIKKIEKFRIYFRYLSIAIIFFLLGFFSGYNFNPLNSEKIALMLKSTSLNMDLLNLQLAFYYSSLFDCNVSQELINQIENQVTTIGQTLQMLDEKNVKNEQYYLLKERYHFYQLRLYLMYKNYIDVCKKEVPIVLYFWGINNESIQQGKILDKLVERYPSIKIFAVQKGYSQTYKFLEDYYKINITPSIVVNYKKVYYNLTSYEVIEKSLFDK